MYRWTKKFPSFFAKITNQTTNNQNFSRVKPTSTRIKKLRSGVLDFENAPVYSTILFLIIVINLTIFLLGFFRVQALSKIENQLLVYFTAQNKYAVLYGYQFWRFFTFPLVENVKGLNFLVASLIIFLTFYRIGYYTEITLGSKQTALLWLVGVLTIGLLQFGLAKQERLYFYGTTYLSLLSVGALFCYYFMQFSHSEQVNQKIRSLLWQTTLVAIIAIIVRYVERNNFIYEQQTVAKTTDFQSWVIIAPLLTFAFGFFFTNLLLRLRIESQLLLWFSFLFCLALFVIGISTMILVYTNEYMPENKANFWHNSLKPNFWKRVY